MSDITYTIGRIEVVTATPVAPLPTQETTMSMTRERMAAVFNEWARRYAEDPNSFGEILDAEGKPVTDYGERCAVYFNEIASELGGS